MERYRITHTERINNVSVEYRADILDDQYGGGLLNKKASGIFFDWEYRNLDRRNPLKTPVQKSTFVINLLVQTTGDQQLLDDILDADEDRFTIEFYIDGTHKWSGKVLTDMIRYPEQPRPYTVQITAKDLSVLEGKFAPEPTLTVNRRLSVLIADLLKETGLTLPIRSFTNLTNSDSGIIQANDFLYEIHHRRDAFELENSMMTCMAALENICRAYNLIIRQSDAKWIIEQLPAVAKGDDIQFDYDSDGLNPTSSTPNRIQTIDQESTFLLPGSDNIVTGAIKSIDSVYNHRTLINNIDTEDVTYTFDPAPTYDKFSLSFENEPIYRMYFSTEVEVDADTASGIEGSAYLTVKGVTSDGFSDQYLTDAGSWSAVQQDIEITMSGPDGSMSGSFEVKDSGGIADVVEEIVITLKWADASLVGGAAQTVTEVRWRNTQAYIFNTLIQDKAASIRHRYTRTGNYSVTEQVGTTVLGDGPIAGNNQASKGRPASGSLASTVIEPGDFRIRGVSEDLVLEEITLREQVNMRRKALPNLRAILWGNYSSENLLSYRGETWFFVGGKFKAKRSRWDANIIQLSYNGDTTGDSLSEVEQGLGVSIGQASVDIGITKIIEEVTNRKRFDSSQKITTITSDISGTVTSIPIQAVGEQFLNVGDLFYLFNLEGASLTEFEVSAPVLPDSITIPVVSKDLEETIVQGSWVIFTGDRLANYINRSDTGTRLGVRGHAQAVTGDGRPYMLAFQTDDIRTADDTLDTDDVAEDGFSVLFNESDFIPGDQEWAFAQAGDQSAKKIWTETELALLQGEFFVKATADGRLVSVRGDAKPRSGSVLALRADNIDLIGLVTAINNSASGRTEIDGGKLRSDTSITVGKGDNIAALTGAHPSILIYAGNSDPDAAPFRVLTDGSTIATRFVQLSGEAVNGVIEHFSIRDLVIAGTLTNESKDYTINEDGMAVQGAGSNNFQAPNAYRVKFGTSDAGAFYGLDDPNEVIFLSAFGDRRLAVTALGSGGNILLNANTKIELQSDRTIFGSRMQLVSLTTAEINNLSDPEEPDMVFNETEDEVWIYFGGSWNSINTTIVN